MKDNFADIISTASLLLAVVTTLLGVWFSDVSKAIDEKDPKLPADRKTLRKRLTPIFWAKSLPLAAGSTIIAGVFANRLITVVTSSLALRGQDWFYDDLKAAFVATELMLITLAGVTLYLAARLGLKCAGLR